MEGAVKSLGLDKWQFALSGAAIGSWAKLRTREELADRFKRRLNGTGLGFARHARQPDRGGGDRGLASFTRTCVTLAKKTDF